MKDPLLVSQVLKVTGDPNAPSVDGSTPLQAALRPISHYHGTEEKNRCIDIAQKLLAAGAKLVGGEAIEAIKLGDWELVQAICDRNQANLGTKHPNETTPLQAAVINGDLLMIDQVIAYTSPRGYDKGALQAALKSKNANLLERVVAVDPEAYDGNTLLEIISSYEPELLRKAISLKPKAYGSNALLGATRYALDSGDTGLVTHLLHNRALVGVSEKEIGAVFLACIGNNLPVLEQLLQYVPGPQTMRLGGSFLYSVPKDPYFNPPQTEQTAQVLMSPLIFALGSSLATKMLLAHNYRVDRAALVGAVRRRDFSMVTRLCQDYEPQGVAGLHVFNPLLDAILCGSHEMLDKLIEAGEEVSDTPWITRFGYRSLLQLAV